MKVTRRSLARIVVAGAAAQVATQAQTPAPVKTTADEDLTSAREQMKSNAQQIAKVKLPMATEPAFVFKA